MWHLTQIYIYGDDLDAANRLIARYCEADPADPAVIDAEVYVLIADGRPEEAAALVKELTGLRTEQEVAGRLREAVEQRAAEANQTLPWSGD